jgi:hypothetical protein
MKKPSKGTPRGKKAGAKKRAVKAVRPKKVSKQKAVAKKKAVAAGEVNFVASVNSVLGCCTIKPPGEADFHIPHVTKKDCCDRARALGAVCHWRPGECA